jgi:hypothetical protein
MQSWIVLAAATACEVAGTVFMKLSNTPTRLVWIPPMLVAYILAFLELALALRTIESSGHCSSEARSLIKVVAIILMMASVGGSIPADSAAHPRAGQIMAQRGVWRDGPRVPYRPTFVVCMRGPAGAHYAPCGAG